MELLNLTISPHYLTQVLCEQKATIKVEDEVVKKLENEKPGSRFTDTLTFKVTSLSGDGLTQVK